jgi:hypothetical protein
MAVCSFCKQEMLSADDCSWNSKISFADGQTLPAKPYSPEDPDTRCRDCNVAPGNFHHPGCDMERCPRCGGQFISCPCELSGSEIGERLDR